jgi:hypothetical protein
MSDGRPMSQALIVAEQLLELSRGNEAIHPIALNLYNLIAFQQRKIIELEKCIDYYGWTFAKPVEHMWPEASAFSPANPTEDMG